MKSVWLTWVSSDTLRQMVNGVPWILENLDGSVIEGAALSDSTFADEEEDIVAEVRATR